MFAIPTKKNSLLLLSSLPDQMLQEPQQEEAQPARLHRRRVAQEDPQLQLLSDRPTRQ